MTLKSSRPINGVSHSAFARSSSTSLLPSIPSTQMRVCFFRPVGLVFGDSSTAVQRIRRWHLISLAQLGCLRLRISFVPSDTFLRYPGLRFLLHVLFEKLMDLRVRKIWGLGRWLSSLWFHLLVIHLRIRLFWSIIMTYVLCSRYTFSKNIIGVQIQN